MLPIAMALERDRSGPRQEGEQEQAGLVPFSSSSSWLELSPIPTVPTCVRLPVFPPPLCVSPLLTRLPPHTELTSTVIMLE